MSLDVAVAQLKQRVGFGGVALAAVLGERDDHLGMGVNERRQRAAGPDRGQLAVVTHEHDLGADVLDGAQEAHLIALACSAPPDERARWTLRLLAQRMVELAYVDRLSYETVRQTLKKERPQTAPEKDVVYSREALG